MRLLNRRNTDGRTTTTEGDVCTAVDIAGVADTICIAAHLTCLEHSFVACGGLAMMTPCSSSARLAC